MNKTINRTVLVIVPKKPFYNWGSSLPDDNPVDKFDEYTSYLLDEGWGTAQAEGF